MVKSQANLVPQQAHLKSNSILPVHSRYPILVHQNESRQPQHYPITCYHGMHMTHSPQQLAANMNPTSQDTALQPT